MTAEHSTGRRGCPNPARRARTAERRTAQAEELTGLIDGMGVRPAHVARLIGCDKSTLVNYLQGKRATPEWVLAAVRALAADPARARMSTVMTEQEWQSHRRDVVHDEPELCVHDWPDDPDRLCDSPADGDDCLCSLHREVSVAA